MYAAFVTRSLEYIFPLMEAPTLSCFAEGGRRQPACLGDYAVLRDEQALYFLKLLHRNSGLLGIDPADYPLQRSLLRGDCVKYPHSCYPKNLRRWMQGTVSRKKKCRVEFAVLLTCWVVGWADPPASESTADAILAEIWCKSQAAYGI